MLGNEGLLGDGEKAGETGRDRDTVSFHNRNAKNLGVVGL